MMGSLLVSSMKVLDLRQTAIGDGEIHAFQAKHSLCQLYIDGRLHRFDWV